MIPDASDPRWLRVLTANSDLSAGSRVPRILISRLHGEVAATPGTLATRIDELRDLVARNGFAFADAAKF